MGSSRRAWNDARRTHQRNNNAFQLWVCSRPMRNFSLSALRSICPLRSPAPIRTVHQFSGCQDQMANYGRSPRMRLILTASLLSPCLQTARSATLRSRTEEAVLLSTSPSYTADRIRSSSHTPSVTESAWAALTKTAELASTRSYPSTQGEARSLSFAGYPSPPMTDFCTLRFLATATSPASASTAPRSESRKILHAQKLRGMARSGDFVET